MSENEKKEGQSCCCCHCLKVVLVAILLLLIGAAIGHIMTVKCCPMMKHCGKGFDMKASYDKGAMGRECKWESKLDAGKCKPGCTCPMCSKVSTSLPDPNKAGCPMMVK